MRLHTQPRKFLAMQPPRRIIPNLPRIPRLQSPHRTRRHRRRHLSPRQHIRRPKRHLRSPFRILRHRNNRVRSVQPDPNQIHSRPHLHPTHSSSLSVSSANSVVNSLLFSSLLFSSLFFSFLLFSFLFFSSLFFSFLLFSLLCSALTPTPLRLVFLFLISSLSTLNCRLSTSYSSLFYRNPVVFPITTPHTTSIATLTTVNAPAATQLKSIRGTPAIDAK